MLTSLIPQVGGFLGGSFFVLMALTEGVTTALIAGVAFVVYMNLENHVIQPAIAGVPGALIATPLVGAAKAVYLEARGMKQPEPDRPDLPGGSRLGRLLDRRRS